MNPTEGRCLLFAYGLLQPGHRPPKTLGRCWPDEMRGLLYDLGRHPAAIEIGLGERWFGGHVLEIDYSELASELDPFEEVEAGVYRRIRATTRGGRQVWVYEYARPLPQAARGPLQRWPDTREIGAGLSGPTAESAGVDRKSGRSRS